MTDPRAAAQRWATTWKRAWQESDVEAVLTLAGISLLQFDADGLVVEEWDAWNGAESMRPRPLAWGGG
jgi:hypothetical protein